MDTANSINAIKVPWNSPNVFYLVYVRLFSDKLDDKKEAINEISVWEKKCYPSLPSAIEATFILTRAVIQDILWTNETSLLQYGDLQAIYGSAITRFVSLCVDKNKSHEWFRHCTSAQIAKSICVPSYIVDIRNEWCHSNKPSLCVLRIAADSALKYLKEFYWIKEVASLKPYEVADLDLPNLTLLFMDFIKFNQEVRAGSKTRFDRSDRGAKNINEEYHILLKRLEKFLRKNVEFFVEVFLGEGIFIPSDKDIKDMCSEGEYYKFTTENGFENEDEQMDTDIISFEEDNFPKTPDVHEELWEPVIRLLAKYDAVPIFMEHLLRSQGDRTVAGQKLLISWVLAILEAHSQQGYTLCRSKRLKKLFRSKGIIPDWNQMLHSAVINPCKYIMRVLPLLLSQVKIDNNTGHKIIGLLNIKLGMLCDDKKVPCKKIFNAKDLESGLDRKRNADKEDDDIWSDCPDNCYKTWYTGYIINPIPVENGFMDIEKEKYESIFTFVPDESEFDENRVLPSNKNEEDDDHHTSQTFNLKVVDTEMQKKDTLTFCKRRD